MASGSGLLSLLQLTDSFFPSGGYAYSWGLETFVAESRVQHVDDLVGVLSAYLRGQVAHCDALVVRLVYEAAERGDLRACERLDEKLCAMKPAKECRDGGRQVGRQVLNVMTTLHERPMLRWFAESIAIGNAWGNHATVFGLVAQALTIPARSTIEAYLYQTSCSIVSAAVRLVPLGHMDGQRALESVKPAIVALSDDIERLGEEDLGSFAPSIEIRAMRHQFLYSRLFRS